MSPEQLLSKNLNSYPYGERISDEYIDFCAEHNLIIVMPAPNDTIMLAGMINKSYYDDESILLGQKGDVINIPISISGYDEFDLISKTFTNTDSVSVPNSTKKVKNYINIKQFSKKLHTDLPHLKFSLFDERGNEQGLIINLKNLKKWD